MNLLTVGFCFVAFDKRPGDGSSFTQASHGKIRGGMSLQTECKIRTEDKM